MQWTILFAIVTVISYVTAAGIGSNELTASWPMVSGSIGYQQITVPDPDGKPLQVAIWYPSSAPPSMHH